MLNGINNCSRNIQKYVHMVAEEKCSLRQKLVFIAAHIKPVNTLRCLVNQNMRHIDSYFDIITSRSGIRKSRGFSKRRRRCAMQRARRCPAWIRVPRKNAQFYGTCSHRTCVSLARTSLLRRVYVKLHASAEPARKLTSRAHNTRS